MLSKDSIVIFAEHWYTSSEQGDLKYMNIDQILNDFNLMARSLKTLYKSKIVAIGYGYSGNLATWLRMKYPHTFIASIANSAPLTMFL